MTFQASIRKYKDTDCESVSKLFYEAVHAINARDYTDIQLFAWAKDERRLLSCRSNLARQYTLVAESGGEVVGFGSIDGADCLDLLFVHRDFQRRGIATALCDELERGRTKIKTYASITAKPFFESRGYAVVKEQEVERSGVKLKNYEMLKIADK